MKSSARLHILILAGLLVAAVPITAQQRDTAPNGEGTPTVRLLLVGDWGTGGAGAKKVAAAMAARHAAHPAHAVISTGDNIYPSGVSDVDDPQWRTKFENIFPAARLPIPFWAVLGNHDYRKNPDAQVAYTGKRLADGSITRWRMPGRAWSTVFTAGDVTLRVIGIDTQQLVANAESRRKHLAWIDSVLSASKEAHVMVVGHHPVYSHGHYGDNAAMKKHLAPLLRRHKVRVYCNGHEHDLQVLRRQDGVRYLISGGGGGKRPSTPGVNTEFASGSMGFMELSFDAKAMHVYVLDASGQVLHAFKDAHAQ